MNWISCRSIAALVGLLAGSAGCSGSSGSVGERCEQSADCVAGSHCVAGVCRAICVDLRECRAGFACVDGACLPCSDSECACATVACAAGYECREGACVPHVSEPGGGDARGGDPRVGESGTGGDLGGPVGDPAMGGDLSPAGDHAMECTPSTVCRPAVGDCDIEETCTVDGRCPEDALAGTDTVCRASAGPCDPAESCDGVGGACPDDAKRDSGAVCLASRGPCELDAVCDGSSNGCPSRQKRTDGTPCPDDGDGCTIDECNGTSAQCQHTAFDPCNGHGACSDGYCTCSTGYAGVACDQCDGAEEYYGYPNCQHDPPGGSATCELQDKPGYEFCGERICRVIDNQCTGCGGNTEAVCRSCNADITCSTAFCGCACDPGTVIYKPCGDGRVRSSTCEDTGYLNEWSAWTGCQ